jgi:DNA repair exonuclease SbcCD ATPase subunit
LRIDFITYTTKQIKENSKQLDKLEKEIDELDSALKSLSVLSDYLNYIKVLCKDENAKQYAISFIMPYLTKQINHYLSKSEINYYINLNNVMDEEIKGPGVYNAGYGNLSGGEGKSIDLAILFSLLDISRLQLGVFPSILLLDELLDTSVDKVGLDGILKIIDQRQKDDNSSVFLVTHRSDITELNCMRIYEVKKKDGFSTIKEMET